MLMFGLFLVLLGILSFQKITFKREDKKVYPGIAIRTEANGFDASKIESDITSPIERVISQVGGVHKITSVSEDGSSLLQIQMDENVDLKLKSLEFREKLDLINSNFSKEVHKPQVFRHDPTNSPLMVISFSKENLTQDELREIVEKKLKRAYESIDGLSLVIVAGGKIREILISCDAHQIESYQFSLRDIVNKIQDKNTSISLGKISTNIELISLTLREKINQILELNELPLSVDQKGKYVYLKDIATVGYSPRDDFVGARLNATEKVSIFLYKNESGDPLYIANQIKKITSVQNDIGLDVDYNQDDSLIISNTYFGLSVIILISILMIFVLYYKQNQIFFILFFISIPFTFYAIIFITYLFGGKCNLANCYGIVLGSLFWYNFRSIDLKFNTNSIQFNSFRKIGKFCIYLIFSLGFSAFISRELFRFYFSFLLYGICAFILLDYYAISSYILIFKFIKDIKKSKKLIFLNKKIYKFLNAWLFKFREKITVPLLSNQKLFPLSLIFLILLGLFSITKLEFLNSLNSDNNELVAFLEFPSGTSYSHTDEVSLQVEKKLKEFEEVAQVISKIEPGHALLIITLSDGYLPDSELIIGLKQKIGSTADGFLFFAIEENSNSFSEVTFDVIGYDQKELESLTQNISEKLKYLENVNEVVLRYKQARTELQLFPSFEALHASDLNIQTFGDELRLALQGGVISKYISSEKEIDIRVRFMEKFRNTKSDFKSIRIKNKKGEFIPISEIVKVQEKNIPLKYYHKNRQRNLSFTVKLEGNRQSDKDELIGYVKKISIPEGYRIESADNASTNEFYSKKIFFLIYPSLLFFTIFLIYKNSIEPIHWVFHFFIPYIISFFLLQFFFSTSLNISFQIGILLSQPILLWFGERPLAHINRMTFIFECLLLLFILMLPQAVISFFYLILMISMQFILYIFTVFIIRDWEAKFNIKIHSYFEVYFFKIRTFF